MYTQTCTCVRPHATTTARYVAAGDICSYIIIHLKRSPYHMWFPSMCTVSSHTISSRVLYLVPQSSLNLSIVSVHYSIWRIHTCNRNSIIFSLCSKCSRISHPSIYVTYFAILVNNANFLMFTISCQLYMCIFRYANGHE